MPSTSPKPPENLSKEQLDFIQGESERTATRVSKAGVRRYARSSLAGFLLLLAGVGYNGLELRHANTVDSMRSADARVALVASGRAVAVDGCNRDFRSAVRFNGLLGRLDTANKLQYQKGLITLEARKAAKSFYANEMRENVIPDCRKAKSIITDDTNKDIVVPVPRFPGDDE